MTVRGKRIFRRKNKPARRIAPDTAKIAPKASDLFCTKSTIFPASRTATNVQAPKTRFLRPKYFPLIRAGTTWEMDADQATLVTLFAIVAILNSRAKSRSAIGFKNCAESPTKNQGTALRTKPHRIILCKDQRRSSNRLTGG